MNNEAVLRDDIVVAKEDVVGIVNSICGGGQERQIILFSCGELYDFGGWGCEDNDEVVGGIEEVSWLYRLVNTNLKIYSKSVDIEDD